MRIKWSVVNGKGLGNKLGFPTINLEIGNGDRNSLNSGVYAGRVFFGGQSHKAGIFIEPEKKILEAHLLDFSGNLRGCEVEIEIGVKLRDAEKFNSEVDLSSQISKDIEKIRNME